MIDIPDNFHLEKKKKKKKKDKDKEKRTMKTLGTIDLHGYIDFRKQTSTVAVSSASPSRDFLSVSSAEPRFPPSRCEPNLLELPRSQPLRDRARCRAQLGAFMS